MPLVDFQKINLPLKLSFFPFCDAIAQHGRRQPLCWGHYITHN